jgi:hypothetical protein
VADRPLNPGGGSGLCRRDRRVQLLGDGIQQAWLLHDRDNRLPQVEMAFDVRRHANRPQSRRRGDGTLLALGH